MADEKDRFGETMKLVERAKEDIYFHAKEQELIERLRSKLKKIETAGDAGNLPNCPKCPGKLESYTFMGFLLDRCQNCAGVWLDNGELEGLLKHGFTSPLGELLRRLFGKDEDRHGQGPSGERT